MAKNEKTDDKPLFVQLEEEILAFWRTMDTFKKSIDQREGAPEFVFFEGPPTANAPPALHHMVSRAFKDLIPRFQTMRGKRVERKAGWDTHGLPVELQIEKALGISGKDDIEHIVPGDVNASIEAFNKACKDSVWEYKKDWEAFTERMGYWLDLEHPYVTYHSEYVESLWWVIKQFWDKGLLFKGHKVVPYCPRCGTALSAHELAQGYKEVEEMSIYVKLPIRGQKKTFLLAWTTTPWTLPGNVALAVGEDETYVKVTYNEEILILAKTRVDEVLGEEATIIEEFAGKDLVGWEYEPLFPLFEEEKAYKVYGADFVTTTDGTGIVHTAVMYGEDDYDLGVKLGLPQRHTVDDEGRFEDWVTGLAGKYVKDAAVAEEIIADLKTRNRLLKEEPITHDYPHCWRCSTPLLYYARDSWFVKMSVLNEQLIANNAEVNWYPHHIKEGRFGEWLKEGKDWAFSRERYWGTPLPVWVCESEACNEMVCVGSYEELQERSGTKIEDPHRPGIDNVTMDCTACGGTMQRERDVVDVWFDSGAMPLAQQHYPFENKDLVDSNKAFPADYICEAVDQTRGWFYTLLAVSTALELGQPYKNVVVLGLLQDKHGKKMSKSKGNIIDPWEMMSKYGADAVRFYIYTTSRAGEPTQFDEKGVSEVVKKVQLIWWNLLSFYQMYPAKDLIPMKDPKHVMDRWVLARLHEVTVAVSEDLERYRMTEAGRTLSQFVNEVSTWYVRRSRDRMKAEETREEASRTLYTVLLEMTKLFAPFMPFLSEAVWQRMDAGESVHLADWPESAKEWENDELLTQMDQVRSIIERGLALRQEGGIRLRQPLRAAQTTAKLSDELLEVIAKELNVKEFNHVDKLSTGSDWRIEEDVALNIHLSEELKQEGLVRDLIRAINNQRKKAGLSIEDRAKLFIRTEDEGVKKAVEAHKEELLRSTLCDGLEWGAPDGGHKAKVILSDVTIEIGLLTS